MDANCGNCRFFHRVDGAEDRCRRYPPTPLLLSDNTLWASQAITADYMWCGEHRPITTESLDDCLLLAERRWTFSFDGNPPNRRASIENLGLSTKLTIRLQRLGINTVAQLEAADREGLAASRGIGVYFLSEIDRVLAALKASRKGSVPAEVT